MKNFLPLLLPLTGIILFIVTVIGWVMNIVKLFQMSGDIGIEFVLRLVGIVIFFIGSVMGFL